MEELRRCTALVYFSDDGVFHHIWQAGPATMAEVRGRPEVAAFAATHAVVTYGYLDYFYTTALPEAEALRRLDAFTRESGGPADEFDEFPLDVQSWDLDELHNGQAAT